MLSDTFNHILKKLHQCDNRPNVMSKLLLFFKIYGLNTKINYASLLLFDNLRQKLSTVASLNPFMECYCLRISPIQYQMFLPAFAHCFSILVLFIIFYLFIALARTHYACIYVRLYFLTEITLFLYSLIYKYNLILRDKHILYSASLFFYLNIYKNCNGYF